MALTFGILAALLTGAAIWLGFLNGHAIDAQAAVHKDKVKERKQNEATHQGLLTQIAGFNQQYTETLPGIKDKFTKKDVAEQLRRDKESELAGLESQIVKLNKEKDYYKSIVPDIGEVERLVERLRETNKNIEIVKQEIETLKGENDTLTAEIAVQEGTIAYHQKWRKNHASLISQEELKGKIQSVYKSWGFVVVNTGDIGGVTPKSKLIVMRGEEEICHLLVKNATNEGASAEILFNTMKEDDFVQVGDVVIAKPKEVIVEAAKKTASSKKAAPSDGGGSTPKDPFGGGSASPNDPFGGSNSNDPFQ